MFIYTYVLAISLTIYRSYYTYNILDLKACSCGNNSGKLCFNVADMSVAIAGNTSDKCTTPERASVEFGILLAEIVKVLEEDESTNLLLLQSISSTLTIQNNSEVHIFNHKQLEEIQTCNIRTLLTINLRHCYRWDDFEMLIRLMSAINSEKCVNLLETFKVKVDGEMKLKQIDEHCKQNELYFSKEYHKMFAIVNKDCFKITKEEYDELKYFISKQCGVEAYILSPLTQASPSSLISEWYIPLTNDKEVHKMLGCYLYNYILSTYKPSMIDEQEVILFCYNNFYIHTYVLYVH